NFPAIADSSSLAALLHWEKEFVHSVCRRKHKEALMPEVLNVRLSCSLSPSSDKLRDVELILLDELVIYAPGVFSFRNNPRHIKPVTVCHVAHGELLHEPGDLRRFASVGHRRLFPQWGRLFIRLNLPKAETCLCSLCAPPPSFRLLAV